MPDPTRAVWDSYNTYRGPQGSGFAPAPSAFVGNTDNPSPDPAATALGRDPALDEESSTDSDVGAPYNARHPKSGQPKPPVPLTPKQPDTPPPG